MRGIEIPIILAVRALDFTIVSRRIGSDWFVPHIQIGSGIFKKSRFITVSGEAVSKLCAVIGLHTFDDKALFFEERHGVLQKNRRAEVLNSSKASR